MPRYDFICTYCGHEFESYAQWNPEGITTECRCGSTAEALPSLTAPARGNFGTVRRNTSNVKYDRLKQTQTPTADEPDDQLEFDFDNVGSTEG